MDRSSTDASAPLTVSGFYYKGDGTVGDVRTLGFLRLGQTAKLSLENRRPQSSS